MHAFTFPFTILDGTYFWYLRMDEYRMDRRVLMAEVSGGRVRGRPRFGWMDGVKVALGNRGMTVEAARQCAKDRKTGEPWYICYNCMSFTRQFCLALCSSGPPSHALVVITWRTVGCRFTMRLGQTKKGPSTENQCADFKYMG